MGKEVVSQFITEMVEDTLQKITGTNEGRDIVAWCKGDGYFADILCALDGIIEVAAFARLVGGERCQRGNWHKLVALFRPHPYILRLDGFLLAIGIEHLVVEA